jgi:hypothetical protein
MNAQSDSAQVRELTTEQKQVMIQTVSALVASYIAEDENISIEDAFERFYSSVVASKLEDIETRLYREGPGYIYAMYLDESNSFCQNDKG